MISADGDPVALEHLEEDLHRAVGLHEFGGGGPGLEEPLVGIHRVDPGPAPGQRAAVERASHHERDAVPHRVFRQLADPHETPARQDRPFLDDDDEHQLAAVVTLFDVDVIELPGLEEGGDGALDVAVGDRLVEDQAGGAEDLRGGQAHVALDPQAVHGGRARVLTAQGLRSQDQEGQQGDAAAKHQGKDVRPRWAQARVLVRARNASDFPSGARSTSTSSPRATSPSRIFSLSGSSTNFWMARLRGRAPYCWS